MSLCPMQKNQCREPQFHQQAPMFPQVHLYVFHYLLLSHLMNLPPRHQPLNYNSQSIKIFIKALKHLNSFLKTLFQSRVSFHITEIITSFTKLCATDQCFFFNSRKLIYTNKIFLYDLWK